MKYGIAVLYASLILLLGAGACSGKATSEALPVQLTAPWREGTTDLADGPDRAATDTPVTFPYASPESQGLSPQALAQLSEVVRGYLADDMIVGAELVIIQNRRVVLHEAIGWKDRDQEIPMERNTLFNIRSMTKPVVGTAAHMLIDEGKLSLDDPISKFLPAFDNPGSREITIEHLLTHRSGLPYAVATRYTDYGDIQEIARIAGERGPEFEPGTDFQYSDAGADALGAVVAQASGVSLETFLEQRILGPLAMRDTITVIQEDDPRVSRIASGYVGLPGNWDRYWRPSDEPLYPFSVGSQSLYATPLDYARFLALWMDSGVVGEQRLLSAEAVQRALAPVSDMGYAINFLGLRTYYGHMWTVYIDPNAAGGEATPPPPVLFGHNGADGTWAWAWPGRDLMVLYFTQSRGQATGMRLEREIQRLLIDPGAEERVAEAPEAFEPYLGVYTAQSGPLKFQEFTVLVENGHLALDIPNQIVVELYPPDERGLWRFAVDDGIAVSFDYGEAGEVTGLKIHVDGEINELVKGTAPQEPELDLEAVQKYLGFYQDGEVGQNVEVVVHNGHLAIKAPDSLVVYELYAPDQEGRWYMRLNPTMAISFNEAEDGRVVSFTVHTPEGDFVRPRVAPDDGAP